MLENMNLLSLLEQERDIMYGMSWDERHIAHYKEKIAEYPNNEYYHFELADAQLSKDANIAKLQRVREQIAIYLRDMLKIG